MDNKLVSIITGTYARPRELIKCIETVRAQTYPNIEHCIVHDGPLYELETETAEIIQQLIYCGNNNSNVPIKFICTGRQWSHFLANSISAVPYQVAQWLASGDYLSWLADDETMEHNHIELLVNLLEECNVDFAYSKSEVWFNPNIDNRIRLPGVIGMNPPICGQITQALYRVELLDYAGFEPHIGSGTDWYQIDTWMKAGASWAFLDKVTHTHRVDKLGDRGLNKTKQILKGQLRDEVTSNYS